MANLFEEFRKRYPLDKRVGEVLGTYVDMEAKQALIFAYGRGYHNGVAECRRGIKDPNPDQPLVNYEHSIVKKEDGYWLILRTESGKHAALKLPHFNTIVESVLFEVTQGADAPKFGEDAEASGSEGGGNTPSGATEQQPEEKRSPVYLNLSGGRVVGPVHLDFDEARKDCDNDPNIVTLKYIQEVNNA